MSRVNQRVLIRCIEYENNIDKSEIKFHKPVGLEFPIIQIMHTFNTSPYYYVELIIKSDEIAESVR